MPSTLKVFTLPLNFMIKCKTLHFHVLLIKKKSYLSLAGISITVASACASNGSDSSISSITSISSGLRFEEHP